MSAVAMVGFAKIVGGESRCVCGKRYKVFVAAAVALHSNEAVFELRTPSNTQCRLTETAALDQHVILEN